MSKARPGDGTVPGEGQEEGEAASGVTLHSPTRPCPLLPPSCFDGGLASAQPPVTQAGSVPRLSRWLEAQKLHLRRLQARPPQDGGWTGVGGGSLPGHRDVQKEDVGTVLTPPPPTSLEHCTEKSSLQMCCVTSGWSLPFSELLSLPFDACIS